MLTLCFVSRSNQYSHSKYFDSRFLKPPYGSLKTLSRQRPSTRSSLNKIPLFSTFLCYREICPFLYRIVSAGELSLSRTLGANDKYIELESDRGSMAFGRSIVYGFVVIILKTVVCISLLFSFMQ